MNAGIMQVSTALLRQALHLPEDARIVSAYSEPDEPYVVKVVVEHPDLPEHSEGTRLQEVNPMFATYYEESDGPRIEFKSW